MSVKLINQIVEAGTRAPSSKNTKPWHFIVLKGKKKDAVATLVEREHSKRKFIYLKNKKVESSTLASCALVKQASVLILIFNKAPYTGGEKNVIKERSYEALLSWTMEVESVSAVIQNMLLATHALGLGGVWLGDFNFARKKICQTLDCQYDLLAGVALGYSNTQKPPQKITPIKFEILE